MDRRPLPCRPGAKPRTTTTSNGLRRPGALGGRCTAALLTRRCTTAARKSARGAPRHHRAPTLRSSDREHGPRASRRRRRARRTHAGLGPPALREAPFGFGAGAAGPVTSEAAWDRAGQRTTPQRGSPAGKTTATQAPVAYPLRLWEAERMGRRARPTSPASGSRTQLNSEASRQPAPQGEARWSYPHARSRVPLQHGQDGQGPTDG
jgi:hypothetical protein